MELKVIFLLKTKAEVFKRRVKWILIADSTKTLSDKIPMNRVTVFNVDGYAICIGKNKNGLFAAKNKCPHEGYSFKGGWCTDDNKFVCPVHRYGFDVLTGRGGGTYVNIYKIEERESGVFVGIEFTSLF